jgi:choline dehydrogenase-like flavoprotein
MMIDARAIEQDETIETDICILGAGAAGITLAREFAEETFRVCLVEGGGLQPDSANQSLYWGENIGLPYFPLDCARASGFGGSGHRWNIDLHNGCFGLRLRPLDSLDFEERDWVPNSGWPFGRSHLDPFYERANVVCGVGPCTYEVGDWENLERTPRLPLVGDRVRTAIFQFGQRLIFIEEHRATIERAGNISVLTHANATRLETDDSARTVTRIRIRCLGGNSLWVQAKKVVVAVGALETPRLLLLSNQVQNCGLGNQNDLVGRYFMEHPHVWSGRYIPSSDALAGRTGLYRLHSVNQVPIMGKLAIAENVQRTEKLLNYCVSIHPEVYKPRPNIAPSWPVVSWPVLRAGHYHARSEDPGALWRSLHHELRQAAGRAYGKWRKPPVVFRLNQMSEQLPNPDSRVLLSEEKDAVGRNRIQLDWRIDPLDVRTIIHSQRIISEELRKAGLGRLEITLKDESSLPGLEGGWHHMGTTRMHVDPSKGVVDPNCRVHGMSNLYIAGPSLFPTGGFANPVLTTVALSIRLADHIKSMM